MKKEVAVAAVKGYRVKEEHAVLIAAIVILALLGSFIKGVLIGRWLTKR